MAAAKTKKARLKRTKPRTAARRGSRKTPHNIRKHEVKGELANFDLAKAKSSLKLEIFANNEKIGELEIGRGSLFWYGRNRHKSKRLNWSRFAEMMDVLAYGEHLPAADK